MVKLLYLMLALSGGLRRKTSKPVDETRINYGLGVPARGGMDIGVNVGVMVGVGVAICGIHPL